MSKTKVDSSEAKAVIEVLGVEKVQPGGEI